MKAVKTKKEPEKESWACPGIELTREEFGDGIHKTEKGPFYTLEEVIKIRNRWRNLNQSR